MSPTRYAFAFSCCLFLAAFSSTSAQETDSLTVRLRDNFDNSPIVDATVKLFNDQAQLVGEKISDANGVVGFSFAVPSSVNSDQRFTTQLGLPYPNPFSGRTSVPVTIESAGQLSGTLYDLLGKQITSGDGLLGAGSHAFDVDLGNLPAGAYIFRLTNDGVEIGSVILRHVGFGAGGDAEIHMVRGAGTALPGGDKATAPGTYRLTVTHPNYAPATVEELAISGRTVRVVQMQRVEMLEEFGTDETRQFTVIANAQHGLNMPRDLEFHPTRPNELWTVNRTFDGTVTFYNAGTPQMIADRREDVYGNHFMEEVSAIAFSEGNNFATAQETNNTYDNQAPGNNFMGPALWTADTSIYVRANQDGILLGSHIDMLHESPYGMGVAHDNANVYWYFDGYYGNIVRYDFEADHGPGYDDHSDGIVRRYMDATVTRTRNVPGHLILDKATGWLYICDPGGRRVTRLNTKTGSRSIDGDIDNSQMEPLREYSQMTGATYEVLASTNLERPCGIVLHNGRLFVTDNETNQIIAYNLEGRELARIQTPAESIMGITVGPDGKLWYVDAEANQVVRVDP